MAAPFPSVIPTACPVRAWPGTSCSKAAAAARNGALSPCASAGARVPPDCWKSSEAPMTALPSNQIAYLTALRHDLHRQPEVSGAEIETAKRITRELTALGADRIWQGLGGHGVAAEFTGHAPGPTVLLRCELDGLPIQEINDIPHASQIDGKGHLCGHDGHMATLMGVAMRLSTRPAKGRVILLFQPAEETGAG